MQDTDVDPWTDPQQAGTYPFNDIPPVMIRFDPEHPEKTITLDMAQHMLQKQYRANPGAFANKAADAFKACVFKDGSDEKA